MMGFEIMGLSAMPGFKIMGLSATPGFEIMGLSVLPGFEMMGLSVMPGFVFVVAPDVLPPEPVVVVSLLEMSLFSLWENSVLLLESFMAEVTMVRKSFELIAPALPLAASLF